MASTRDRRSPSAGVASLAVALVTVAAFLPAVQNRFLNWDDDLNVVGNPHYRGLGWPQLRWMVTTTHMGHYHPLTWITLGLDYLLWGMNPAGYHLTSVLLHAASAAGFYFVARRLLAKATPVETAEQGRALRLSAAFAALLFAVHPLRVESVAWVSERRDVLSGLFYLLALLAYLRASDTATQAGTRKSYWASLGLFALALLSKATAVTLPVILVVLDAYPLRRLGGGPGRWFGPAARRVWAEKIPFVLLAVGASVPAFVALVHLKGLATVERVGLGERAALAVYGLAFYLWKTLAPVRLSPLYERPLSLDVFGWPFLLSAGVVLFVTALAIAERRRWPALAAVWISHVVMLLPVLGIVQTALHLAADRYTYLACLGWALLGGAGLRAWWLAWRARARAPVRRLPAALALVVVALLAGLTWHQVGVWRDSETLWAYVLSIGPSSVAHAGLGNALASRGELRAAMRQYEDAIRLNPGDAATHSNWGMALLRQGQLDQAIDHFGEALRIDARHAGAHNNLGLARARQGRLAEAAQHLETALRFDPTDSRAHNNLGVVLGRQGAGDAAMAHYRRALEIDPQYTDAHINLGVALTDLERWAEAATHFEDALRITPRDAAIHNNLGYALARQGQWESAIAHYRRALQLSPGLAAARANLTSALARQAVREGR